MFNFLKSLFVLITLFFSTNSIANTVFIKCNYIELVEVSKFGKLNAKFKMQKLEVEYYYNYN